MFKRYAAIAICVWFCFSVNLAVYAAADNGQNSNTAADYAGYIEIADADGLRAISDNPGGSYVLMADINMKDSVWYPIEFNGILEGNGHTIYNLYICATNTQSYSTYDGNHIEYATNFAGLFSRTENAVIKDLRLLNEEINITVDEHVFVGGLVGLSVNTEITGCSISGRIYLYTTKKMFGAGGIVGFGTGSITDSEADVTIVTVDGNPDERCEAFLGGVLACGYSNIDGCKVKITGYASLTGYMHTGGIVGMFHKHDAADPGSYYIKNCTIEGTQYYYENNPDQRKYCYPVYGEILKKDNSVTSGNEVISFEKHEYFTYDKVLLPEKCSAPEYTEAVTEPTCTEYGYTTYICTTCGYSYSDDYVCPAHKPGEWVTVNEPTYSESGSRCIYCQVCGALLEEESIARLTFKTVVEAVYQSSEQLATILPEGAPTTGITWASSDESVASVDENGKLSCIGCGSVVITGSTADGFTFAEFAVNITYQTKIGAEYKSSESLGTMLPEGTLPTGITWTSSDESIAAVDANGNLNCVGRGSAIITGSTSDGLAVAEYTVKVTYSWWQWIIVILLFGWLWY